MSSTYTSGAPARRRIAVNAAAAACAVLIFHAVSVSSGRLDAVDGLGWDGFIYARMVTGKLADGNVHTRTRPLTPLMARVPYALGAGVVESFQLLNYLYAFVLYLVASLLLERYGATVPVRAVVIGNLALCIATSKLFAFYPAQVDLGALALTTLAFYLSATDRRWSAGIACVLATASREFGVAASLYGMHRTIRRGRPWQEAALIYLPSVAMLFLIRWWVTATDPSGATPLDASDAVQNLRFLSSPVFAAAFAYFAVVVFGGISAVLFVRPGWCLERLRDEPELATFLILIVGASAAGNFDIWRYLMFALPVAVVLMAQYCRGWDAGSTRRLLIVMTLFTVLTQRPFEWMDTALYFRDWFPLYNYFGAHPPPADLVPVWSTRFALLGLMMAALYVTVRPMPNSRRIRV